ncbi:NUDIX hydrolase [Edaphobacter aggregans]|uniref:NUDIX hydrolase n=1 Tax=Edaphobacter aggregans TaxID=570835 RepID=UPI001B80AE5E|nr:NUDIX hydrolase [Edaphobacter aggregans]
MSAQGEEARVGREYPQAPIVGVAAVVLRGEDVLLIRRGREPMLGAWSLPGGALELGETTAEGVAREVLEETGVRVRPVAIVATLDRIVRDEDGRVRYHYVLVEWLCLAEEAGADPICGDDAVEARWVSRLEIFSQEYDLGASTLGVVERALKLAEMTER